MLSLGWETAAEEKPSLMSEAYQALKQALRNNTLPLGFQGSEQEIDIHDGLENTLLILGHRLKLSNQETRSRFTEGRTSASSTPTAWRHSVASPSEQAAKGYHLHQFADAPSVNAGASNHRLVLTRRLEISEDRPPRRWPVSHSAGADRSNGRSIQSCQPFRRYGQPGPPSR